ncbi:iron chelate uptake ABC transporter family permease subunit [Micrococcus endophyticus]
MSGRGSATLEHAVARVRAARRGDARRVGTALAVLTAAVLALVLLRLTWGAYMVAVPDLVRILTGTTIPGASFIVTEEKLPRAAAAVLAGAALGAAGALYRRGLGNPLASPDVLGVTSGAAAGAVLWQAAATGTGGTTDAARAAAALAGGLIAALAVLLAARGTGGERFVVAGIAVAAGAQAVVAGTMVTLAEHDLQAAALWVSGSLTGVTWGRIGLLAAAVALTLPLAAWLHGRLEPADTGEDLAHALGARPRRTRPAALLLGAVLAAATTAAVGPLAFVALLATPLARGLAGGRPSLAAAALAGAVLVLAADLLAAEAVALLADGTRLPTGVLTGAAGAPLMMTLLIRAGRRGERTA